MILVTGGAGYIGSVTTLALREAGFETVVADDLSKGNENVVFADYLERGDIRYRRFLDKIFSSYPIDAVVHLAARSVSVESMLEPETYYQVNVEGSLTLLSAMKQARVNKIVYSSTASVYGNPISCPIDEDAPKNTASVYGDTKLFVESVLGRYHHVYGMSAVIFRYFNAAGADPKGRAGENHRPETHLIPLALDAARGRRPNITIYGDDYMTKDGTCVRDYVHVSDIANAHVLAVKQLLSGESRYEVFNLGSGCGYSVKEIISVCEAVTKKKIKVNIGQRRAGDPGVLVASCERAMSQLGWQPQYQDIEKIIETAWNWHKKMI